MSLHIHRHQASVLVVVLLCCSSLSAAAQVSWRHAVIIDAGSTGSRAHVFRYQAATAAAAAAANNRMAYPLVELPESVLKTSPGLSAYAFDPTAAAKSLQPLLKFAKSKVPAGQWQQTPIQLMATAGLRMIKNGSAELIMAQVDKVLSTSGFKYTPASAAAAAAAAGAAAAGGARVLSGAEEGLLGWVAINYATGALQAATNQQMQQQERLGRKDLPKAGSTPSSSNSSKGSVPAASSLQGVLELGGGSLQVTFLPSVPPPPAEAFPLSLPSLGPHRLYSRSFDGLGLQAAMARWEADLHQRKQSHDPCLPAGFGADSTASTPAKGGGAATAAKDAAAAKAAAAPAKSAAVSAGGGVGLRGSGDWRACKAGVVRLLPKAGRCQYSRCGLAGTFLPAVEGATFVGVDNLFYTASALGLSNSTPISLDALDGAAAAFCGHSWSHIVSNYLKKQKSDPAESYHAKVCFSAALILGLLKEGLHLTPSRPLLTASNSITTPQGRALEAKWPLGALVVNLINGSTDWTINSNSSSESAASKDTIVISNSHKAHKHPLLGSEEDGLSAGSAAALAAAFCMAMLALSLCASWLGVGLPGSGRCGLLWQQLLRMQRNSNSSAAKWLGAAGIMSGPTSSGGGAGGGGSTGGSTGGSSSSVRYMRVRPSSRSPAEGLGGPRSRSTSPQHRPGGGGAAGGGSISLTVLPVGGEGGAAASWSVEPRSANGYSSINVGGSKGSRATTARQR